MLSLNNAYNKEEVRSFYEKTFSMLKKKFYILAETKVDGLSASLRYENRKLIMGLLHCPICVALASLSLCLGVTRFYMLFLLQAYMQKCQRS